MIINFAKEAAKRNIKINTVNLEKIDQEEDQEEVTAYQGSFIHNEDKVLITVEPDKDRVTLDLFDVLTDQQYTQFTFDSYTLFLIVETARRMFKELDGVIDNEGF